MNAAIVLIQGEIETLQERKNGVFGREKFELCATIGELADVLDFRELRGCEPDTKHVPFLEARMEELAGMLPIDMMDNEVLKSVIKDILAERIARQN